MIVVFALLSLVSVQGTHQQVCSAAAHLGRWWYNGCAQRCVCETKAGEYVWNCYRERKEFTCMSSAQRSLFIETYKLISTPGHPEYAQYQTLIARHSTNFAAIHTTQNFLPWHRWFAMELENLLQNVNCKVTLPWWDTAKNAGAPWGVSPWGAPADLMGTSGACINNGGFASPGWPNGAHGCISRTNSGTLPTAVVEAGVLAMVPGNYGAFSDALENQIHNLVHVRVAGTMVTGWSPEDPIFFLHHGHIDYLWDLWQRKSAAHLAAYSFPMNAVMPVAYGATPAQFNNLAATNVKYVRNSLSTLGNGHFLFLACNLIKITAVLSVDLNVLQSAMVRATPTLLRQIPQLPAPVLTAAEEKMMIDMNRRGGGTERSVQEATRKLAEARNIATKANEELEKAGSLREYFEGGVNRALGFDVAQAVKLLKVPPAQQQQTAPATAGVPALGRLPVAVGRGQ